MSKKYLKYLISVMVLLLTAYSFAGDTAEYVGDKKCRGCHKPKVTDLATNIHSKARYWDAEAKGCESCHGAGSIHASTEAPEDILNPVRLGSEEASAQCLTCHEDGRRHWDASPHDAMDVSCVACHSVHGNDHPAMLKAASIEETCYDCHSEQRAYTLKRSAHPLRDASRFDNKGKMTCSSCHNPHGTQAENLISANTVNDKCYECHQEMKAPVLWEHSAVKESCLNCHNPHGSNHEMLLVAKEPRLCQQCHQQGRHQTIAGEESGFFVRNRSCSNCHAQIHGSNHPGGVKIKR